MYALGRLSDLERTLDTPEIILSPFIYREAASSSQVEGTRVTLSDIFVHELGEAPGETFHNRADIDEAYNYVEGIKQGINAIERGSSVDETLLRDLHRLLLDDVRGDGKDPGEYRERIVGIGQRNRDGDPVFIPPPASSVPFQMRFLVEYIRQGPSYAPLIDIGLVHYQFETVHPFLDGNGRLGRLLIMLMLYKWELLPGPYLYPSAYFNAQRDEYVGRLLSVSQRGEWDEWLIFFLTAIADQAGDAYESARELLELRDRYRNHYLDAGPVLRELVEYLFERPYLTIPVAVEALEWTYPAVNSAMTQLDTDGVVVEITGKQSNRRFEAREIIDIIEH